MQIENSTRTHDLPGDRDLAPRCIFFHIRGYRKLYCSAVAVCLVLSFVGILVSIWHLDLSKGRLFLSILVWRLCVVVAVLAVSLVLKIVWVVLRAVCRLQAMKSKMIVFLGRLDVRIPKCVDCRARRQRCHRLLKQ